MMFRPNLLCNTSVSHSNLTSTSSFETSSRGAPDSLEKVHKCQTYHLAQAAAVSWNVRITELKE